MNETIEQKRRRLFGKQYLEEYKNIISKICRSDYDLLSIVDSDKIFNELKYLKRTDYLTLAFDEKIDVWDSYKSNFVKNIYLITKLSEDCGIIKVKDIDYFNINFDFFAEPEGMILIANEDLSYKLLFDFYEDDRCFKIDIVEYKK